MPVVELFVRNVAETEPRLQAVLLKCTEADYLEALKPFTRFTGTPDTAATFIRSNKANATQNGLSSLWITADGEVIVIAPDSHTTSAFYGLSANCPPAFELVPESLVKSKGSWHDLNRAAGLVRAQYYSDERQGVGCSIVLEALPTAMQVASIIDLYGTTGKDVFVCELYRAGELIERFTEPLRLYDYMEEPEVSVGASPWLRRQRHQSQHDEP